MKLASIIIVFAFAMLGVAAAADSPESAGKIVWYTGYKCPEPADATAPGASPERAIALENFGDPIEDELSALEGNGGKSERRFTCKWVRVTGFFAPTGYYHYRGHLFENAWSGYRQTPATDKYLVERFRDPSARRSAIGHRRVTLVGRFYNLCATAPGGEDVILLLGPCHYGAGNGMMLTDVIVEQIADAEPRYLVGELNRAVIGALPAVESDKRAMLVQRVRDWAAAVKRGPEAYATQLMREDPNVAKFQESERRTIHDDIVSGDSYFSYLSALAAFRKLNTGRAQVAVFWDGADMHDRAVGCICLKASCTNEWPLTTSDAESFYGHAACTILDESDGKWLWR